MDYATARSVRSRYTCISSADRLATLDESSVCEHMQVNLAAAETVLSESEEDDDATAHTKCCPFVHLQLVQELPCMLREGCSAFVFFKIENQSSVCRMLAGVTIDDCTVADDVCLA